MMKVKQSKSTARRVKVLGAKRQNKSIVRKVRIMGIVGESKYSRKDNTRPIEFEVSYPDYEELNDEVRLERDALRIYNWITSLPHGTFTKLYQKLMRHRQ